MKIALNGTALLSPLTGIGQYTYHLACGLKAHDDFNVDIFYGNGWSGDIRNKPLKAIKTLKSVAGLFIPKTRTVSRLLQQRQFSGGIKRRGCVDLYHEPNYLAYQFNGPTVVTVHDLSWIKYPETHFKDRIEMMDRFFDKSLSQANMLITDSEFIKNELIETFGINPNKICPVSLGVEPVFSPKSSLEAMETLKNFSLGYGGYILALGTLEPRKNLQSALEAFLALPMLVRKKYPLVLVGMTGWKASKFESLIEPLVKSGEVRQLGYISRLELINVIAGAKTLIYPSIYEGFGLPPLEAMACGVPVIASNVSSIPEVVGDAGILINPNDIDQLKDAILNVIEDDNLSQNLSAKGVERSKLFTWDNCVQQTMGVYRKVLAES